MGEEYRPKPTGEGGKCGAISRFIFNWELVANITTQTLNKSIVRPYMQMIARLIEDHETIPVNISVSLRLLHKNMSLDPESSVPTRLHFVQTIEVTSKSEGWIEFDITPAVQSVWTTPKVKLPIIEVTLRMEVDCVNHRKVPLQFVNPAEVELHKTFRREKFTTLQPLLVVYLEDRLVKEKLYTEKMLADEEKEMALNGNMIDTNKTATRQKRAASLCGIQSYTVNFTELHLDYIISPLTMEVNRCTGSCSADVIDPHPTIATNHARIKASAKKLYDHRLFKSPNSTMYNYVHENPCCAPVEYESRFITIAFVGSVYQQLFPDVVAKRCGCR